MRVRIGSGMSLTVEPELGTVEAAEAAAEPLAGAPCRLAVLFASPHHADALTSIAAAVTWRLRPEALIGAVAQGVVGPSSEIEDGPAISVWCATWSVRAGEPRPTVEPFRSWATHAPDSESVVVGWPSTTPEAVTILLADPHTYPAGEVVTQLGESGSGHRIVGGLVTPGHQPGRLIVAGRDEDPSPRLYEDGAVGVVLNGVDVKAVVSQGCRPVGEPFVVTRARGNLVLELAGAPAAQRLQEVFAEAPAHERELMRHGLHVGLVANEYRERFDTGDFLIRGVLGADPRNGAVAVGEHVEVGQTLQFQVRDAGSAHDDLLAALKGRGRAAGALLFTCNGRGRRFFHEADHDVGVVREALTEQVAGAFCAGEIGPVGDRSFLHGFTASLAVFPDGGDRDQAGS
ncbi:MAG: FIST C-terminal domain-containing protein [Actinomycetota bacterium]|nr:FIST C-terminal domain-containing protein [Actinomycetota bacterium]